MFTPTPLRIVRSSKDPIFRKAQYRALTELLTGKREVKALYAHCAKVGSGIEELSLRENNKPTYVILMDAPRINGLCFPEMDDAPVARMEKGRFVTGPSTLCAELNEIVAKLPASNALVWTGAIRHFGAVPNAAALADIKAKHQSIKKAEKLEATQKVASRAEAAEHKIAASKILELSSLAQTASLSSAQLAQLKQAAPDLLGKKKLSDLFAELGEDEQVVLCQIEVDGKPRFDAWLLSALEDGVFFVHRGKTPSGLVVSQADVHDQTKKRRDKDIAILEMALKLLKKPARGKKPRKKR